MTENNQSLDTQRCQALAQAMEDMHLSPSPSAAFNDDAMVWEITLIPGVVAELLLQRTSYDDHQLTLVTTNACAHDAARWRDLDTFADVMGSLAAPNRLIRLEEELGLHLSGRALGADALVNLLVEMVALQRYALVTVFDPWVALSRGECDGETAAIQVHLAIEKSHSAHGLPGEF